MKSNTSVFYLPSFDRNTAEPSEPLSLFKKEKCSEKFLQDFIHENPSLLPVEQIEPAFDRIFPVCRELQLPSGFLDNLYVTSEGNLVLVECKLWSNPEARRKVLAQIMDYAKDFKELGFDGLSKAINSRLGTKEENPLYNLVAETEEGLDEAHFTDNVSRNLRLGRLLLLIVGDGIQEGTEKLTEFLQQNMGLHFTMGLVEMGLHKLPDNKGIIVTSQVLTKTTLVERGVFRIESDYKHTFAEKISIVDSKNNRPRNLTEREYFEALGDFNKGYETWLKDFVQKVADLGVTVDVKQSLSLRYAEIDGLDVGLGYFRKDGTFMTENSVWRLSKFGQRQLGEDYVDNIARILTDSRVKRAGKGGDPKLYVGGRIATIGDLVGHDEELLKIIENHIYALNESFEKLS